MDPKTEELGYKLMLAGPQLDFYLNAFAKRIAKKMRLNYLNGQVKIIRVTCPSGIWWYFVIVAKKYGAEVDFNLPRQSDIIKIKSMSTFRALLSPQRVGKLVHEKRHFKRSKIMENGQLKTISKFVGKSKIVCDPDHIMKFIYQNGTLDSFFCRSLIS